MRSKHRMPMSTSSPSLLLKEKRVKRPGTFTKEKAPRTSRSDFHRNFWCGARVADPSVNQEWPIDQSFFGQTIALTEQIANTPALRRSAVLPLNNPTTPPNIASPISHKPKPFICISLVARRIGHTRIPKRESFVKGLVSSRPNL